MAPIVLPGRTLAEAFHAAGVRIQLPPVYRDRQALEHVQLSKRESQVMSLVVAGLSDREISARLHLDRRWITRTITNLVARTGSASKLNCAVRLARAGKIR